MSFIRHDLRCGNGHIIVCRLYRRSDGPPVCSTCGAPTSIAWLRGSGGPALSGFGTIATEGGAMTTGDFETYRRRMEAAHPGQHMVVETPSDAKTNQRIEERRQRVIESRRENGIDAVSASETRVAALSKEREDLSRGKVRTSDIHKDLGALDKKIVATKESFSTTA